MAVVSAGGTRIADVGVRAGFRTRGTLHRIIPGLALEPSARRAVVVPAGNAVVSVDLRTLAVRSHRLVQSRSLVSRLLAWLEPTAEAKGIAGPERRAVWVGGHLVAVTGTDSSELSGGRIHAASMPLKLVDTRNWRFRTTKKHFGTLAAASRVLLAYGGGWASDTASMRPGLTAFDADGKERYRVLGERYLQDVWVVGGYAYAADAERRRFAVVDLASGRVNSRPSRPTMTTVVP